MAEFFDKMIVGINKGASNLKEGSKNIVEKANLNTSLHKAEDEKNKLAQLLGLRAYEIKNNGVQLPDELLGFCEEMAKIDERIAEYKRNLAALETKSGDGSASLVCGCGNVNKPGSKFCAKCGSKLAE